MTELYNRFSVQILATVDARSTEELLSDINKALGQIPKFNIKAVSHDKWADGYTGRDRVFDENGDELSKQAEAVATETMASEIEVEQV